MSCLLGRCALTVLLGAFWLTLGGGTAWAARLTAVKPPSDPLFKYQWNLAAIQIPAAWAVSRGAGATVAVLDTGVAYEDRGPYRQAPDLAAARFVAGWDFVDDDAHPDDVPRPDGGRSHGTQMAALIAQTAGNGIGGAGVAPDVTIMPIRVLRPDVTGSAGIIAKGLRFAADHGADVANLSIAGASRARVLRDAVDYASSKGVTIVAAAGNDGSAAVSWPAAYPKVIAVGAIGQDRTRAPYSNYGTDLDLVAPAGAGDAGDTGHGPGDGVLAQTLNGGPSVFCLCFTASTSAAAAQVSGVAALLVGSGRAASPADIRTALLASARDLGPRGRDREYGAGLVQAASALAAVRPRSANLATRTPRSSGLSRAVWLALSVSVAGLAGLGAVRFARRKRGGSAAA